MSVEETLNWPLFSSSLEVQPQAKGFKGHFSFMSSLEDLISISLYRTCKSSLEQIAGNNPDLRHKVDVEFNSFLQLIHKKIGRIQNCISSETPLLKSKVITATTTNFIFKYTIHPNRSSDMEIATIKRYGRQYPPDFLLSKVKPITGFVYFLSSEFGIKIGCTSKLKERLNVFTVRLPFETKIHSYIECKKYNQLESTLHNLLSHKRINGEWFKLTEDDFVEIDMLITNMKLKRVTENG